MKDEEGDDLIDKTLWFRLLAATIGYPVWVEQYNVIYRRRLYVAGNVYRVRGYYNWHVAYEDGTIGDNYSDSNWWART